MPLAQAQTRSKAMLAAQDLQAVVQAAASQVETALTCLPMSLTGDQLKAHQAELQNLQSAIFEPLRALQQACQQLTQTQAELGQMQAHWHVLQQEHSSLTALLRGVKDRMQQLADRHDISAPLRQTLRAEGIPSAPFPKRKSRLNLKT
ncbi:MAG: hypothetical protein IGS03_15220 [Candidatus Sericytochromatia bacterium]|nr:hypothetical protein [Candidatus Sericytochromatia bacterium]